VLGRPSDDRSVPRTKRGSWAASSGSGATGSPAEPLRSQPAPAPRAAQAECDLVENGRSRAASGATANCSVSADDELAAVNGTAVRTDANGSVTQDGTGGPYIRDVRNRLANLTRSGAAGQFG
jgi:hypothetical protein